MEYVILRDLECRVLIYVLVLCYVVDVVVEIDWYKDFLMVEVYNNLVFYFVICKVEFLL